MTSQYFFLFSFFFLVEEKRLPWLHKRLIIAKSSRVNSGKGRSTYGHDRSRQVTSGQVSCYRLELLEGESICEGECHQGAMSATFALSELDVNVVKIITILLLW